MNSLCFDLKDALPFKEENLYVFERIYGGIVHVKKKDY